MLAFPAHATGIVLRAMPTQTRIIDYAHGSTKMSGYLATPDAPGKRPAIMICHEWWGLNDYIRGRANQIATELGYVAFALDMFGNGATAKDHQEAAKLMNALMTNPDAKGRVEAAFDVLKSQPSVDVNRIAALGYCMGGSMALDMAISGMSLRAVVTFHAGLKSVSRASGPIKSKIQLNTGADDPMVPPEQLNAFEDELRKATADWQANVYGGAEHAFTNPNADKAGLPALKYNAAADKRSWHAMRLWLEEAFA